MGVSFAAGLFKGGQQLINDSRTGYVLPNDEVSVRHLGP